MAQRFRDAFQRMAKQAQANMPGGSPGGGGGGGGRAAAAAARSVTALAVAAGLGYGTYNSIYTVQGGHRAVVFNRIVGMKDNVYGEGLNFNIPWFEHPVIYDIRTRPVNLQTLTGSKDLQMVTIAIRVLHKPDPSKLVWIYRFLGTNYDERILPSVMNECAKAVVARYNANELLTKRDLVSREISVDLRKRAGMFNILLEDVAITHLSFSPEYARAVEAKQVGTLSIVVFVNKARFLLSGARIHVLFSSHHLTQRRSSFSRFSMMCTCKTLLTKLTAQQEAEKAKYVVLGAQQEKKTIITKAKGEAESAELIGKAVQRNPGFMSLRRIDAARDIADIVSQSGNKVYLNADTLLLNLLGDQADEKFSKSAGKKGWY